MARMSRRDFLKVAGISAAGLILTETGCAPQPGPAPTSTWTNTPVPTETGTPEPPSPSSPPPPTETITPTPTQAQSARRPEIMQIYPNRTSKVVHTHLSGIWSDGELVPEGLNQLLDVSITKLTGLTDAQQAWEALFDPGERIAIKVNTIMGGLSWTPVPLVMAVVKKLQEIGVPGEQIVIYDRQTTELRRVGFPVNSDGSGVVCQGTDGQYTQGFELSGIKFGLSDILLNCDALINMPSLKQHGIAGITFALKNHYGTIDVPSHFHSAKAIKQCLPGISALPEIRERTRLIIGSALAVALGNNWDKKIPGDSIFMSFDPIAHDTAGLQLIHDVKVQKGENPKASEKIANGWLRTGTDLGIGTTDPEHMEIVEIHLQ